jgi:hypothetical protein
VSLSVRHLALSFGCALVIVACGGGDPGSGFLSDPTGSSSSGGGGDDNGPTLGGVDQDGGASSSGGNGGSVGDGGCATTSAEAQEVPVYLVFMFDRSGSMKFNPSPNAKWDSCVAGLDTFFSDPGSKGLYASMQVFPYTSGECSTSTYQNPIVPVTALPDTTSRFQTALGNNGPQPNYGTPTLPAFKGAMAYAQSVKSGLTNGEKVAVVLVTDGDPNDCNSSASNVGAEAAKNAADIPTYVIGVGPDAQNLNTIATGGGTAPAIIVDTSSPQQITQKFLAAIGQIKSAALSCEYQLPSAPAGQTLDVSSVNVVYTPSGGAGQTLSYNKDCSGSGTGWHYDDPNAPSKIEMCQGSCDTLKAAAGRVDIVLGCATQGGVTK